MRHSVTSRYWLVSLSLLRLNLWTWIDKRQCFLHPKIKMVQRWQVFRLLGHSLGPNAGTAWDWQTVPHAPQIFITLLWSMWEWKSIHATQELPHTDVPPTFAQMQKTSLGPLLLTPPFAEVLNPGPFATFRTTQPLSHTWPLQFEYYNPTQCAFSRPLWFIVLL